MLHDNCMRDTLVVFLGLWVPFGVMEHFATLP